MIEKEQLIALVENVQKEKRGATTKLYETFHEEIYYYILKTVNNEELAADLTQDSFIEIFQTIQNLREPAAFVTWSRQIAYHRCTAHFRKRKELLLDENEDGGNIFDTLVEEREEFIPDEALEQDEFKKAIRAMIDSLPEEQRAAIMMRYFDEFSVKEIADIQGTTEGTVKSRLNYGRKAIKQAVEDYEKKSGTRIHCVGVIPLLLWLFREQKKANAAAGLAKEGVRVGAQIVIEETIKAGAWIGAKHLSGKIVAAIVATAVLGGGIVVGLFHNDVDTRKPPRVENQVESEESIDDLLQEDNTDNDVGEQIPQSDEPPQKDASETTEGNHSHDYELSETLEATCEKDGYEKYLCACGASKIEEQKATGHSYDEKVTPASCGKRGYTTFTCTTCNHSYKGKKTRAKDHEYTVLKKNVNATMNEIGYRIYACECGDEYTLDMPSYIEIMVTCYEEGNDGNKNRRVVMDDQEIVIIYDTSVKKERFENGKLYMPFVNCCPEDWIEHDHEEVKSGGNTHVYCQWILEQYKEGSTIYYPYEDLN